MKSRLYRNLQAMQPYLVHQILVFRHKSFSYIACRLWNNLPSHVREAPDLKNFVAKLKELKLSQVECPCKLSSS